MVEDYAVRLSHPRLFALPSVAPPVRIRVRGWYWTSHGRHRGSPGGEAIACIWSICTVPFAAHLNLYGRSCTEDVPGHKKTGLQSCLRSVLLLSSLSRELAKEVKEVDGLSGYAARLISQISNSLSV